MYFNVSQLLEEPNGSSRAYEVNETLALVGDTRPRRIFGTVRMLRTDTGIWVRAEMDSHVECECSRCLNEFEQPIHMTIEEEYLPKRDIDTGARLGFVDHDEDDFYIDEGHMMDLSEAARQYASLSLPMKQVCREDCEGLCLSCGVNLNDTPCKCDNTTMDIRWGPLLKLVPSGDKEN